MARPQLTPRSQADMAETPSNDPSGRRTCKAYLLSWGAIMEALGLDNKPPLQRQVRKLNKMYNGPIVMPEKRGGQPEVCLERLLDWWDDIEKLLTEARRRQLDKEETLAKSYQHGRDATVIPEIGGHLKKRRQA